MARIITNTVFQVLFRIVLVAGLLPSVAASQAKRPNVVYCR